MGGDPARHRWRAGSPLLALVLVAISLVAYAGTLRSPFIGDDHEMLLHVSDGASAGSWLTELGPGGHVRPVAVTTFWLSHQVGGLDPFGYHLVNVVLNGLVAWLVALVAAALVGRDDALQRFVPAFAGVAFVVWPTHVEAVTWMVCRVDLILTALCLLSLLGWMRWRRSPGVVGWLPLGAFVLALGTKEAAITFPLVLVALELWRPDADGRWATLRRSALRLGGFGLAVVAYLAGYLALNGSFLADEGTSLGADGPLLIARRGLQVVARTVVPGASAPWWGLVAVVGLAAVLLAVVGSRRAPERAALARHGATFGFLATSVVVVVAPVARLGASVLTPVGGRLAYLPSAFAVVAIALALGAVTERAPRVRAVSAAAIVVGSVATLVVVNASYGRASATAGSVVASTGRWPADSRVVSLVGLDSVEGLPVGRNAVGAALQLVGGWTDPLTYGDVGPPKYTEAFAVELADGGATVSVQPGDCARCYRVRLDDDGSRFIPLVADDAGRTVELAEGTATLVDDRTIEVELDPGVDPSTLWVVSGGRLVSLTEVR